MAAADVLRGGPRVLETCGNRWVQEGDWWTDTYTLLGLTVRYRVVEVAGESRPALIVEDVQATPP